MEYFEATFNDLRRISRFRTMMIDSLNATNGTLESLTRSYAGLQSKVRILYGEMDQLVRPTNHVERFLREHGGTVAVEALGIPEAGHMIMYSHPEAVVSAATGKSLDSIRKLIKRKK